jgi:branched-chain amino acid transport system substrate-binding protein
MRREVPRALAIGLAVALASVACNATGGGSPSAGPPSGRPASNAPSASGAGASGDTIKIGLDIPFSGSDQFEGQHYQQAAQILADEVNGAGGIMGHKVETVLGDNQCDPSIGVTSARKLMVEDKVDAMVGSACSSVTLAVMPLLAQYKVPEVDATATNAKISQQSGVGGNIWKYRLNLDDGLMDSVFAQKVMAPESKKVAIFAVNTDYGRGAVDLFTQSLQSSGSSVVDTLYYTQGQPDFRSLLTKVKGESPDGILLVADYPDAAQILLQAHELGITAKWYGRGTVVTDDLKKLVNNCDLINGVKEVNFWAPNADSKTLADKYQAKFNQPLPRDVIMAYYAMKLILDAIQAQGGKHDPESIRQGLKSISEDLPGLGHVTFDDHNQAHYPMAITTFKNCEVMTLETVPTN